MLTIECGIFVRAEVWLSDAFHCIRHLENCAENYLFFFLNVSYRNILNFPQRSAGAFVLVSACCTTELEFHSLLPFTFSNKMHFWKLSKKSANWEITINSLFVPEKNYFSKENAVHFIDTESLNFSKHLTMLCGILNGIIISSFIKNLKFQIRSFVYFFH